MIVGPIQAQMDDFCDLHGTPDTPVSRIVTVKMSMQVETPQLYVFAVLNSMIAGGSTNTMGGP